MVERVIKWANAHPVLAVILVVVVFVAVHRVIAIPDPITGI
jgi:hypothetical protein